MPNLSSVSAKHVTSGVLSYLKKTNRLHLLPQVAHETAKLSHHQLDPSTAIIEAAVPLSDGQRTELKTALEVLFKRDLNLVTVVSPQVLGGLRIKVGDQVIDQSLNARINQLTQRI
jgi:F-type H+-transporting ATPase subunit delta